MSRSVAAPLLLVLACGPTGYEARCVPETCSFWLELPAAERCWYDAVTQVWSAPEDLSCGVGRGCAFATPNSQEFDAVSVCVDPARFSTGSWPRMGRNHQTVPECEAARVDWAAGRTALAARRDHYAALCPESEVVIDQLCLPGGYSEWTEAECAL